MPLRKALSPDLLRRLAVALGLLISVVMVARSQAGGDQLNLLSRGWLLAERGELIPYGNPLSSGGDGPGSRPRSPSARRCSSGRTTARRSS